MVKLQKGICTMAAAVRRAAGWAGQAAGRRRLGVGGDGREEGGRLGGAARKREQRLDRLGLPRRRVRRLDAPPPLALRAALGVQHAADQRAAGRARRDGAARLRGGGGG